MTTFHDHFSGHARTYATARPRYGGDTAAWLASLTAPTATVWDVGTGSGQLATLIAPHVAHVIATDASAEQLAQATRHPRVEYRNEPAETTTIADGSIGLVTVAQAVHWFALDRFYAEVRRVCAPGAAIVLLGYELMHVDADVDAAIWWFYKTVVGPYWPAERAHLETGYRELPFPFPAIDHPPLVMAHDWTRDEVCGYVATWSAVQRAIKATGQDPMPKLVERLTPLWHEPAVRRTVTWPLIVKAGRVV